MTGGYVYRGQEVREQAWGRYFYGDYCSGRIWSLARWEGEVSRRGHPFGVPNLTSFGEDLDGELYALSRDGSIYQLVAGHVAVAGTRDPAAGVERVQWGTGHWQQTTISSPERIEGDTRAFGALVEEHQTLAFRTAYLLISGSAADAEDAVQDAFVKAYKALGRFRPGAPFRPWLLAIVANEARNRRRSAGRRERLALRAAEDPLSGGAVPSPEAALLESEQREELLAAVNDLREDDRLAIACRYFLGLSEEETAAALGWRRGTRQVQDLPRARPPARPAGGRDMTELERALVRLGDELAFPETPDVSERVLGTAGRRASTPSRRVGRRALVLAFAVLALARRRRAGGAAGSHGDPGVLPPARARRVQRVESLPRVPPATESRLDLGRPLPRRVPG